MKHRVDHRLIRQMLLFAAVAEESSIRQAAEKLNMSVPPLLAQLNELEERLQIRLFVGRPGVFNCLRPAIIDAKY